jgi:DNA-directed RNA polymerase subunit H (RpoH/RPB5)
LSNVNIEFFKATKLFHDRLKIGVGVPEYNAVKFASEEEKKEFLKKWHCKDLSQLPKLKHDDMIKNIYGEEMDILESRNSHTGTTYYRHF